MVAAEGEQELVIDRAELRRVAQGPWLDAVVRAVLYDELRSRRAEQAEEAGVPRYVVLTNRDAELLVRRRPDSLAALGRIPGIGKAKLTRYGEALLELLQPAEATPEPEPTDAEIAQAPS